MKRSFRGRKARFIAVLVTALPLTLFALAQAAWAAGVPAPSPGSPMTPVTGPLAGPFSMVQPAALAGAVAFTIAVLVAVVVSSRREATGRVAAGSAKAGSVTSAGAGLATLLQRRHERPRDHQRQTRTRKHAA
jgi:hypothetical protein